MFEFANGRFVNPARILTANVYSKEQRDGEGKSTGASVLRVAIELDSKDSAKASVYSDPMPSMDAARSYISSIPVGNE